MIENQILEKAALIRGQFINHVAFIEKMLEILIGTYFCKNEERSNEMIEFLLGDRFVSFESKRTTFESIMKKHFLTLYKQNKTVFEHLTTIQMQRNRFAHLIVYTGAVAEERYLKDGAIAFIKFGYDTTKPHWYDNTELSRISIAVNVVKAWLPKLLNEKALS